MLTIRNLLLLQVRAEKKSLWLICCLIIFFFLNNTSSTSAQITPDTSLPTNSRAILDANGDLITITGGTDTGNNLFHSFQEFSVPDGQTAFFDNSSSIENIFSRVTGSSISNIEGIIRANGAANLFLLNPNGIIFGPNASLNIGGSFVGSTADSIQFSDGSFYSAVNPQAPSLLTINIPLGLQYGAESGNIIVQGNGNNTGFRDPSVNDQSLVKDFRPTGLQVSEGNTLALIGGNIALDGGNLTAAAGHIELSSVQEGLVKFEGNNTIGSFDYQDVTGFQDIALVNAGSVEVSGNSSGTVNVQGQNITLTDASAILSNTSGDGTAGSITLNGTESVQVTGVSQTEIPFVSYVSTGTTPGSTGEGADLNINTRYLLVAGGAQVDSPVFGSGDGGTLSVNAERVELIGGSRVAGSSGLFTPVVPGARGDGGDINIEADSLLVAGGAQVFALSVSTATGGEINIEAQDIELNGTSPNGTPSGVFTNTLATGNSGNLNIETNNLVLRDGGDIGSSVLGTGKTGNIIIKANHIDLSDSSSVDNTSSIFATVANKATGVSGDITIETESLILNNGTQISSSVEGSGKGGNIDIRAHEIDLIGYNSIADESSGLFTTIFPGATGDSGNITITADNLRVSSGAQISVATGGFGFAGDLTLRVSESIELTGNAIAEGGGSSGLFSSAVFGDGNGGNLDLTTDQLIIKDGATVSASNFLSGNANVPPGTGLAGDITINAQTIVLNGVDVDTPSSINASTFAGGGGNIELNSQTITATNGAQVNAETSGKGDGGLIQVNTENFTLNNGAVFSSRTSAAGDAGTISVTGSVLEISNQGTITTSSTGNGQAGNIDLKSAEIQTNQGLIIATSEQSGGGDINITNTEFLLMDNNSLISTSVSDSTGGGGNIVIASDYIVNRDNSDIRANASFGDGGTISINTEVILLSADSNIDASSDFGIDGIVEIDNPDSAQQIGVVQLSAEIPDSTGLMTSLCSVEEKNVMAVTGKGGLAENPSQVLRGQSLWEDLRDFSLVSHPEYPAAITKDSVSSQPTKIIEAEGWIINPKGNVQLVVTNYAPFNQCKK